MNLLIFIFCILYFVLAFKRLDVAVMLLIVAMPAYLIRSSFLGVPFTLLEAMILISFFVWFLRHTEIKNFLKGRYGWKDLKENRKKRLIYPFGLELTLLLVISYMAVAVAGFSNEALGVWKAYFFEPSLVFILVLNVFRGKNKINNILWPLVVSASVVSLFAIYQKFTGNFIFNEFWANEETRRVTSFFGYPNAVGLYLGPLILIFVGWFVNQLSIIKYQLRINIKLLFIPLTVFLSLLSIYFAKSEGALIGVVAGLVMYGLLINKKIRWAMLGLIILVIAGIMVFAPAKEYATSKVLLRDLSGQIRKAQWVETWSMLNDGKFIFGSGLTNYKEKVLPYHQEGIFVKDYKDPDWHRKTVWNKEFRDKAWQPLEVYLYPHNIFLNFWVELGIAGMFLFIWIMGKYSLIGIRNLKSEKDKHVVMGLMGAMVTITVHGLVDVPYFKNDLAIMFWLFVAMLSLINLEIKNEK